MTFLDALNGAVQQIPRLPRVRFEVGLGEGAETWLKKKHANGCVHEPATLAAFLAVLERYPVRRIFDAGALYGYFTLFALQAAGDEAEVIAFEMHPGVIGSLRRNVAPYATCVHAVLSDEARDDVNFWISGFNIFEQPEGGWEQLEHVPGAMKPRGENNRGRGFAKVDFITLDAYCKTADAPDLIKIDVEGYQAKALAGGMHMIKAKRPVIIIELHDPEKLARFGTTNKDTVQPLFDLGYQAYWCPNFRSPEARFERVIEMGEAQEKLCIMVFVP